MRKPLERENGRYKKSLDKLELIAKDTVENVCKEYPDIDVIDLQFCFENVLRFEFAKKIVEESVDVESR
jgi:hypothetical protein